VWSYKDCQDLPSPWACRRENDPLSLEDLNPGHVESVALQTLGFFLGHGGGGDRVMMEASASAQIPRRPFISFPSSHFSRPPAPMASQSEPETIIDKLEGVVPENLTRFDAFPKLPATYKSRTDSRGFLTLFVALLAFFFILNDIGEYIWGWPDYEFSIDAENSSSMDVNVDMVVNMPCGCQSEYPSRQREY
jgi:hypothetical protein